MGTDNDPDKKSKRKSRQKRKRASTKDVTDKLEPGVEDSFGHVEDFFEAASPRRPASMAMSQSDIELFKSLHTGGPSTLAEEAAAESSSKKSMATSSLKNSE